MAVEVSTVQGLAQEAAAWFECVLRDPSDEVSYFVRVKDGAPEWITDLCRSAHYGLPEMFMLPDDWRYSTIRAAVECIAGCDDPGDVQGEFADGRVDVYTSDRVAWLGSHSYRPSYCDEALEQYSPADRPADIVTIMGEGQYMEASEVFGLVLGFLSSRAGVEA